MRWRARPSGGWRGAVFVCCAVLLLASPAIALIVIGLTLPQGALADGCLIAGMLYSILWAGLMR